MMMNLRHYASQPVVLEARTHKQDEGVKPSGLWLSVGNEWLEWCRSEDFRADPIWYQHQVTPTKAANLLHLSSARQIVEFTSEYGVQIAPVSDSRYIDWPRVAAAYDGIVIAPYQWSCRSEMRTFWYYGWDVASGCIWNTEVVSLSEAVQIEFAAAES